MTFAPSAARKARVLPGLPAAAAAGLRGPVPHIPGMGTGMHAPDGAAHELEDHHHPNYGPEPFPPSSVSGPPGPGVIGMPGAAGLLRHTYNPPGTPGNLRRSGSGSRRDNGSSRILEKLPGQGTAGFRAEKEKAGKSTTISTQFAQTKIPGGMNQQRPGSAGRPNNARNGGVRSPDRTAQLQAQNGAPRNPGRKNEGRDKKHKLQQLLQQQRLPDRGRGQLRDPNSPPHMQGGGNDPLSPARNRAGMRPDSGNMAMGGAGNPYDPQQPDQGPFGNGDPDMDMPSPRTPGRMGRTESDLDPGGSGGGGGGTPRRPGGAGGMGGGGGSAVQRLVKALLDVLNEGSIQEATEAVGKLGSRGNFLPFPGGPGGSFSQASPQ